MSELQFNLTDYRLYKLNFTIKEIKEFSGSIEISPIVQCMYKHTVNQVDLKLSARIDGENTPFTIDVAYIGIFNFNIDLNSIVENKRDKIIRVNCAATIFPFIRETIAETTRKAGLKPLLLPSFNFLKAYECTNSL